MVNVACLLCLLNIKYRCFLRAGQTRCVTETTAFRYTLLNGNNRHHGGFGGGYTGAGNSMLVKRKDRSSFICIAPRSGSVRRGLGL